jgi:hypothetical protein
MTKFPLTIAAAAVLLTGTAALAQTPVAKPTAKTSFFSRKKTTVTTTTTAAKPTPAATKTTVTTTKPSFFARKTTVTATKPAPAAPGTTVTTTATTPPVAAVHATTVAHSRTTTTTGGRMVQAKLKNGKTVTYDCSKAGNKDKTACK